MKGKAEIIRPLISIIMPVYNCEEFIEESISSIINQTYINWELIIVNDGSADKTEDKIAQFNDNRIHVISLNEHRGLTKAFAEGYSHAAGEYVLRHDGDDTSAADRLEKQVDYLEKNPDTGMVSCMISCFTREPLFRKDCVFIERIQNFYCTAEQIKKAALSGFLPILFPTLMIRRSVLDKAIAICREPSFDDHTELLLKLLELSSVEKLKSILYYYRRHNAAYHVVNQIEYEKYSSQLMGRKDIKNRLQYGEFYNNSISSAEKNYELNKDSSIRVLMLIDALNVGGTETHVLNITKALIDKGIYVVIATSGGPLDSLLEALGVKIIKFSFRGDYISNKKKNGMAQLLKSIVDREKINIVHCHLFASMQLANELYRMYKIPYIVTVHGLFYPNDILYSTCLKASSVIAVSEPVRQKLNEKLSNRINDKIVVIPNYIDADLTRNNESDLNIEKELSIPSKARILCYCSRLDWNKTEAARALLFSFSQLIKEFYNIHLVIIGDGPGKSNIEMEAKVINQMAGKELVHVIGARVNVIPYFLKSAVVIGTARVAIEGMMCGKPIIAIGNEGYTGIVSERNYITQWNMYFGDHDALEKPNVTRLVKDIRYLLHDYERRKRIGRWGRKWCAKYFNNDNIVNDIIELYRKAIEQTNLNQ